MFKSKLMLVMLLATGCAGVQKMSGAFAACAKADLGAVMASGGTLLGDVAGLIEGNAATLEADLTALAVKVGLDAVDCAISAVEEVVSKQPAPPPGPPAPSAASPASKHPGLDRARAWRSRHRR